MITQRLQIDPLGPSDHLFILELLNTEGWLKFIGDRNVRTPEEARLYVQRIMENANVKYWVVKTRQGQQPVGIITFIKRDYLDHHDIGFAFLPQYAGRGYAYEAALAMLQEYMAQPAHQKLAAITLPRNAASIRILEKLGMQQAREILVENEKLLLYEITRI